MKNDETIKLETGTNGMMQMAEMMAPGTQAYKAIQTELEKLKEALATSSRTSAADKKQMQDQIDSLTETVEELRAQNDDYRANAEYYRDMYNQQVGASKVLLYVIVSLQKVEEYTKNASRSEGMMLRSVLPEIAANPTPEVLTAIIHATQLPKSSTKALDDATEAMAKVAAEPRVKIDNLNGTATGTATQTFSEMPQPTAGAMGSQLSSTTPKSIE